VNPHGDRAARTKLLACLTLASSVLAACGGGSGGETQASSQPPGPSEQTPATPADNAQPGGAAALAQWAGKPPRLLVGLGSNSSLASIRAQNLAPDIYNAYLVGVGAGSWVDWNSPAGQYVVVHAANARSVGAIPMFTLYQMASNGDGNLSGLNQNAFMTAYWDNVRLMFRKIAESATPSFVVLEPDFWGYAQQQAPAGDPSQLSAMVASANPDCDQLPDNVIGVAQCLLRMRDLHAPQHAKLGFMPSAWAAATSTDVATFMKTIGADKADFTAIETLDRDAGCFEVQPRPAECNRGSTSGWYWDASAYQAHLATVHTYRSALGLPLIWWQTPMGVPSSTAGGSPNRYRDNRMQFFLTGQGPADLVSAGAVGVVFSQGHASQTGIDSDGGQYQRLSTQYLNHPAALP